MYRGGGAPTVRFAPVVPWAKTGPAHTIGCTTSGTHTNCLVVTFNWNVPDRYEFTETSLIDMNLLKRPWSIWIYWNFPDRYEFTETSLIDMNLLKRPWSRWIYWNVPDRYEFTETSLIDMNLREAFFNFAAWAMHFLKLKLVKTNKMHMRSEPYI
jgi:predicted protein tyrosine phosphatase